MNATYTITTITTKDQNFALKARNVQKRSGKTWEAIVRRAIETEEMELTKLDN